MNLVATFDAPPPAFFRRLSYVDKIDMRMKSPIVAYDNTSFTDKRKRIIETSQRQESGKALISQSNFGDFSVFGGDLKFQCDTLQTRVNVAQNSSRSMAKSDGNQDLLNQDVRGNQRSSDGRCTDKRQNLNKDADPAPNIKIARDGKLNIFNKFPGVEIICMHGDKGMGTARASISKLGADRIMLDSLMSDGASAVGNINAKNTKSLTNKSKQIVDKAKSIPKKSKAAESEPICKAGNAPTSKSYPDSRRSGSHKFEKIDFAGIGSFCRNAGSTKEGLQTVVRKVFASESLAISVMWSSCGSSNSHSNNHSTSTVKYCTPSVSCHKWYCSCDRHIRVQQAFEPLLGALILFPDELQHLYFLPLSTCVNPSSSSGTSSSSENAIPLNCQTTLEERWTAFLRILLHKQSKKIIYNFQLVLLPLFAACYGLREDVHLERGLIGEVTLIENIFDPRVAAYLCETDTQESGFEFNALCNKFQISREAFQEIGLGSVSLAVGHSHSELKALLRLQVCLQLEIDKREGTERAFRVLEMPLVTLLSLMELRGLEISHTVLTGISSKIERTIAFIVQTAHETVGTFNLASPEQVANVLYEKLKLPSSNSSAKGRHSSTSEEDLMKIRTLHPIVDMILSFRSLSKISTTYIAGLQPFLLRAKNNIVPLSTYTEVLPYGNMTNGDAQSTKRNFTLFEKSHQATGHGNKDDSGGRSGDRNSDSNYRVHANWNQTTVRTGRLSCCRPNLQNIPNRQTIADMDISVRSAFKAADGCILVAADYSQIEMRVMAQLCQDKKMMSLFNGDGDIYKAMAAQILGKSSISTVTSEERNKAKVICLGTIYGMGPALAAAKLGIDIAAANRITYAFFNSYKEMKQWMTRTKNEARKNGYVQTVLGRRRYLPEISSPDPSKRAQAERQAVNSVIQGSASDIIKLAMVNVEAALVGLSEDVRAVRMGDPQLLMQIHDELIYEVKIQTDNNDSFKGTSSAGRLSDIAQNSIEGPQLGLSTEFKNLLHRSMGIEVMESLGFKVPLTVTIKAGPDWGNMTELK